MSDYVGWCVAKELTGKSNEVLHPKSLETDPLRLPAKTDAKADTFGLARAHAESGHGNPGSLSPAVRVREFDD